jgi:hypothetical protein
MVCSKNEIGEGTGRGISGRCINGWKGRIRRRENVENNHRRHNTGRFYGAVKNRYTSVIQNVDDKK